MTTTDETLSPETLPPGWSRGILRDLCASIQAGPMMRTEDRGRTRADTDGGTPVVLPRDLREQRIASAEAADAPVIPWNRARTLAKYQLAAGDVLLTRTGTVGRCALVTGAHTGWLYHPNLVRLRLPPPEKRAGLVSAAYLAAWLSATDAHDWINTRTAGAVIPSLSIRTLGELPVLLPPGATQETIGATLAALDDKIQAHAEIVRATRDYRAVLADALTQGALSLSAEQSPAPL
ncbi:restriction endonuclease subunit S [Streptomyces graminilatus]|uniref:restriction endonuclease subunit S n=1 Tax=Streptomyces graminilatus TaxID=1464070 RepID=UPI0006E3A874|nr:restriction endonuclease subunit S [Streptomyces graminilatus]